MARSSEQVRARSAKKGSVRLDRHSGTGRLGTPKKGGAGTKYIWGVAGDREDADFAVVDKMDPNFSEDEEGPHMSSRATFDRTK